MAKEVLLILGILTTVYGILFYIVESASINAISYPMLVLTLLGIGMIFLSSKIKK